MLLKEIPATVSTSVAKILNNAPYIKHRDVWAMHISNSCGSSSHSSARVGIAVNITPPGSAEVSQPLSEFLALGTSRITTDFDSAVRSTSGTRGLWFRDMP